MMMLVVIGGIFMQEILVATILIFVSIGSFIICSCSFRERGFLINNAYIYASKPERERMDKKPHYHQTAIVFLLLGIIFLLNGLEVLLNTGRIYYVVIILSIVTIIYAIISSIMIAKRNMK
jgi:hypothetical protein